MGLGMRRAVDEGRSGVFRNGDIFHKTTCIFLEGMVYYTKELRWSSSDNTSEEPDASGSSFYWEKEG